MGKVVVEVLKYVQKAAACLGCKEVHDSTNISH